MGHAFLAMLGKKLISGRIETTDYFVDQTDFILIRIN